MHPTVPTDREPVLDALRGVAILGILLVNIEVMRGSDWLVLMAGDSAPTSGLLDGVVQFTVGWLATGKFISSLAILFGVGAGLIAARALRAGQSPRPLLAKRYAWLVAFGIAHMPLFPGDILFLYGLTGLVLLLFVRLRVPALLLWSAAILGAFSALGVRYLGRLYQAVTSEHGDDVTEDDSFDEFISELQESVVTAYEGGTLNDILAAHVSEALLLQSTQLLVLPWVLALFLFGFSIARAGLLNDLRAHGTLLRRGALIGLAVGLPANIGLGFVGALAGLGMPPQSESPWMSRWADFGQFIGAPVLAVGYLCALSLYFLSRGSPGPLVAVGRMALTAYILQSALALAVFGGLRLYDQLSSTSALLVVAAIWALLLVMCPLWLRRFRMGPLEWLWRSFTYGRGIRSTAL